MAEKTSKDRLSSDSLPLSDPTSETESPSTSTATIFPEDKDGTYQDAMDAEAAKAWEFVLSQLARQLEYYMSCKNLAKDTYVQTLRTLNDGCVPVAIIANFMKVKQILMGVGVMDEQTRKHAIWLACSHYSSKLAIATIDTQTGKQIAKGEDWTEDSVNGCTIMAVGTVDNEPIKELEPPIALPSAEIANTLVLRDVAPVVTAEDILALFQFEGCPPIISIVPDVAHCWFVTLDTTDRSDVMYALLQIRGETLAGEHVHARIKTSVTSSVMIDPVPFMPVEWQPRPHQRRRDNTIFGQQNRKKRNNKAKNKNSKTVSDGNTNRNNENSKNHNWNKKGAKSNGSHTPSKKPVVPPPPSLGEEDFPTLLDNRVEWETPPVQDEGAKANVDDMENKLADEDEEYLKSVKNGSDSASTATTASSSTESGVKKVAYAAALQKSEIPDEASSTEPKQVDQGPDREILDSTHSTPVSTQIGIEKEHDSGKKKLQTGPKNMATSSIVSKPLGWGRGTFADILRETQAAS